MSMWQRLSSVREPGIALKGVFRSSISAFVTWFGIAVLACLAPMVLSQPASANPLIDVLNTMLGAINPFTAIVIFLSVVGLYGAMLSTGSTQLIAISHTVHEDLLPNPYVSQASDANEPKSAFRKARLVLILSSIAAIAVVELLSANGFSIADLVFSIYGAQLGMCPVVIGALTCSAERLKRMGG